MIKYLKRMLELFGSIVIKEIIIVLTHIMTRDKTFDYAQMITTNLDYDVSNILYNIITLLTNDL